MFLVYFTKQNLLTVIVFHCADNIRFDFGSLSLDMSELAAAAETAEKSTHEPKFTIT